MGLAVYGHRFALKYFRRLSANITPMIFYLISHMSNWIAAATFASVENPTKSASSLANIESSMDSGLQLECELSRR